MAARTILTDDITPTVELPEGATSTRIQVADSRESFNVEIDLGDENFKRLMTALRKFKDNGREVVIVLTPAKSAKPARDSESDGPTIRKWAQDNPELLPEGVNVPGDKGALSKGVVAAYDAFKLGEAISPTVDVTDAPTDV